MTESHPDPRNPDEGTPQHNADAPQPEHPEAAQNTAPQGPEQSTTPNTPAAPATPDTPAPAQQYTPYPAPVAPTPPAAPASYAPPTGPRYGEFAPPQQQHAAPEQTPPASPAAPTTGAFGQPESAPTATATAPRRRAGVSIVAALAIGAVVGGVAGAGVFGIWSASQGSATRVVASSGSQTITVNNAEDATTATAVAAKATPSVVTIAVTGSGSSSSSGTGSGIILSKDGYVLTNTHVVTLDGEIADPTISVTTSDGKIYAATLVGTDPTDDLAVIKLTDASGLTPITWGDSSQVNVGDTAVAIGAPLGLASTVTDGIISALNRSIQVASSAAPDSSTEDDSSGSSTDSPFNFDIPGQTQQSTATTSVSLPVIQTDASINPGNSGGALLNSDGELIGINVAIASASSSSSTDQSGSIGVGFAIESNVAKRIADEIIQNGSATHGLLGASVADSTTGNLGAAIQDVTSGGAAAAAGLKKGDIVTNVNGTPITSASDLTAQVRAQAAGSDVTITYVRGGETFELKDVTLGTMAG